MRRWIARTAALVLCLPALAAAPSALPAQASTTPTSLDAATLTALSQADEVVVAARTASQLPALPALAPQPDGSTVKQDSQALLSWIGNLDAASRAVGFPDSPTFDTQTQSVLSALSSLAQTGTVPNPQAFLSAASYLAMGVRSIAFLAAMPAVDSDAMSVQLPSVLTFITIQEGGLDPQTLLGSLPQPPDLITTVEQEVVYLTTQQFPVPDTQALLVQADQVLIFLGEQLTGPLGIAGPTAEQALDDAGAVNDAVNDLLAAPPGGVQPPPPVDIPDNLTVAAVSVGPGHAMLPNLLEDSTTGLAGPGVDATIDSTQDALAAAAGYRCYTTPRTSTACVPPLKWHGGKVQHRPRVYVIFWGPQWNTNATVHSYESAVTGMFGSLSGSGFQAVLSQYYDTTSTVSTAMTFAGAYVDATPPLTSQVTETDYVNEAIKVAKANHLSTSDDTQWMFYPQPGIASPMKDVKAPFAHCGYHNYGTDNTGRRWVFGEVDYPAPTLYYDYSGCGTDKYMGGSVAGDLTVSGSHEYAEAVTDPFLNAWSDSANPGHEIGDMCRYTWAAGSVTQLWSNNGSLGSCTTSFTPSYTYKVLSALAPAGEPGGVYARGHAYEGGQVLVSNTGNMPWFPLGSNATYLGTWSTAGRCSHIADMNTRDASNPWKGCTRLRMTGAAPVQPRAVAADSSAATFDVRVKADGAYVDGGVGSESFNLVSSVWMSPSSGGTPTLIVPAARFNAKHSAPATGEPLVAGVAGTDMPVQLDFTNNGSAPWYQNEVVYLGTTNSAGSGHASYWAASTWPKTGACSNCRAARVTTTTAPSNTYTFKFTVHIPATAATGVYTEYFRPVADVPVNLGGVTSKYFGPAVPVTIVVVGVPVGSHQLTADGTIGSEPTEGYDTSDLTTPTPNGHWFMCAAVATADALSTTIDSCGITVSRADGTGYGMEVSGDSSSGGVASVVGRGFVYDETAGDTAMVCWSAHATYLDGSTQGTSGCS